MTESIENTEDYKQYREAVRSLAKGKSSLLFSNSGIGHASAVLSTIFNSAKEEVRLYAKNMSGRISNIGDYNASLRKYLLSGKKLYVVLDQPLEKDSNALKLVKFFSKEFKNQVKLSLASEEFKTHMNNLYKDIEDIHYCVGDSKMFRIETDCNEHKAICSFNNEQHSEILKKAFKLKFDTCKSIG